MQSPSITSDGGALSFSPCSMPQKYTAEESHFFSRTPIFVVVVTATRQPAAASSFAVVSIEVVLPPLPINETTSPRQIWSVSVRAHILLRLKLRIRHSRSMRDDMLYIREYGHVCPFYRDQTAVQLGMNRSERGLYKRDKNGRHRVLSSDNNAGIRKWNRGYLHRPTDIPLFSAVRLFLILCSK